MGAARCLLVVVMTASGSPSALEALEVAPAPAPMLATTAFAFPPRLAHGYRTLHVPLGHLALDATDSSRR